MDLSKTEIIDVHQLTFQALLVRDLQMAFNRQIACTLHLTHLLETSDHQNENWTLQLLYSVALDTRIVTGRAASTGSRKYHLSNNHEIKYNYNYADTTTKSFIFLWNFYNDIY